MSITWIGPDKKQLELIERILEQNLIILQMLSNPQVEYDPTLTDSEFETLKGRQR